MTQPAVTISELDGALGVLPPSAGQLMAFIGASSAGALNTPASYARVPDLIAAFGAGPLVEAAAYYIGATGRPALIVRSDASVAAAVSAVTHVGTGTSVATIAASPTPADDYEYVIKFTLGGTIATGPISYQESYDGGRTYGPVKALGTAEEITLGGTTFEFAAGTVVTGDTYAAVATAAQWSTADLTASLTALGNTLTAWEQLTIVGALDGNALDAIELKISGWRTSGKYKSWIASPRIPAVAESAATYIAAMGVIFSAKATKSGTVAGAAAKITSGVSGRKYRRPINFAIAAAQAVSEEINIADVNRGSLPGVSIRDDNGNADEYDESLTPGLDDLRMTSLRTWDGYPGVYVNRPRLLSPDGSDFQLIPHRRVLNLTERVLRNYFILRLNKPIRVNATTGFILETEALDIEMGARAAMASALLAAPKASGVQFVLSRTDNVLSTKTLTGTARVIPLAYPEFIDITVGYENPALVVIGA